MVEKMRNVAEFTFAPKSPDQVFVMVICLALTFPILTDRAPAPASLEKLLPEWVVFAWALSLVIGSLVVLVSYLLPSRVLALIFEQFGSVCLASAALLYGVAILSLNFKSGAAVPGALILGFAVTRAAKAWQIQGYLNTISDLKRRRDRLEGAESEPEL